MMGVAVLCALAGLVLGFSSNVRMLILVVLLLALAALVAGGSQEGSTLVAVAWSVTAIISSQVGYITTIVLRVIWSVAQAKYRLPVPY